MLKVTWCVINMPDNYENLWCFIIINKEFALEMECCVLEKKLYI